MTQPLPRPHKLNFWISQRVIKRSTPFSYWFRLSVYQVLDVLPYCINMSESNRYLNVRSLTNATITLFVAFGVILNKSSRGFVAASFRKSKIDTAASHQFGIWYECLNKVWPHVPRGNWRSVLELNQRMLFCRQPPEPLGQRTVKWRSIRESHSLNTFP